MLRFAGFELDPQRAGLRGPDGETIRLRPKSFDMLQLFVANAGRVLSKRELIEAIWPNVHVGEDSLFQCIREIRAALGDDQRQLIKLVSGRGYLFEAEVSGEPITPRGSGEPAGFAAEAEAALAARAADGESDARTPPEVEAESVQRRRWFGLRGPAALATVAGIGAVVGLAAAAPIFAPNFIFARMPPTIAVMPIVGASTDPQLAQMAASVTDRLTDGLAKIDNIRVVAPRPEAASASPEVVAARSAHADFVVSGELQKEARSWNLQARMSNGATGEVRWTSSVSVGIEDADLLLQQSRLAAGLGHPLALRINAMLNSGARSAVTNNDLPAGNTKVVIEQAMAFINQTTPERFQAAQAMLEKALAAEPDNVPTYLPVLEGYCRFLTATNDFAESLIACARILTFDPWDGLALFNLGITQVQLGRFEDALATFKQADQFDTPQVSRWTWLLGAGWTTMLMGRNEEALSWLQRSIAITPGTGRTHALLAAAYQLLGRTDEAKAAMAKTMELRPGSTTMELRPGSTAGEILPPTMNASPVFLEANGRIIRAEVEAGLPER